MALFARDRDAEAAAALREAARLAPEDARVRRNLQQVELLCGPECF
jgi:hypothetical protein